MEVIVAHLRRWAGAVPIGLSGVATVHPRSAQAVVTNGTGITKLTRSEGVTGINS